MRFTSSSYEKLLKVLIQGLEDKTLTVKLLKEELKLNEEREEELGEHNINPSVYLDEALEEVKAPQKKKRTKSLIVEYVEDVVRFPHRAPKKVLEQYADEKGMTGRERSNFLALNTKRRIKDAADFYQIPLAKHEKEMAEEFAEWKKSQDV